MGRISTSPRYVINITRLNWLSLGELGVGVNWEKFEKNDVFLTYQREIRS